MFELCRLKAAAVGLAYRGSLRLEVCALTNFFPLLGPCSHMVYTEYIRIAD